MTAGRTASRPIRPGTDMAQRARARVGDCWSKRVNSGATQSRTTYSRKNTTVTAQITTRSQCLISAAAHRSTAGSRPAGRCRGRSGAGPAIAGRQGWDRYSAAVRKSARAMSGPCPSRGDHRRHGLRIATRGRPVYGRARFSGQGSNSKVVRDLGMAVDIAGHFPGGVLEEGGRRLTRKLLTTPQRPEEAVLEGRRLILADAGPGFGDVGVFVHGTTPAPNAATEHRAP